MQKNKTVIFSRSWATETNRSVISPICIGIASLWHLSSLTISTSPQKSHAMWLMWKIGYMGASMSVSASTSMARGQMLGNN
ncbi:hypothetical protein BJX99DRAFT_228255 [Aspergillus californicus]